MGVAAEVNVTTGRVAGARDLASAVAATAVGPNLALLDALHDAGRRVWYARNRAKHGRAAASSICGRAARPTNAESKAQNSFGSRFRPEDSDLSALVLSPLAE